MDSCLASLTSACRRPSESAFDWEHRLRQLPALLESPLSNDHRLSHSLFALDAAQFLSKNGFYEFWNWFDDRTW